MRLYDQASDGSTSRARSLRRRSTEAERKLWRALRERLPGTKLRRQTPVGPYIVDFLCFAAKLVVELDGGQHGEAVDYDERRTAFLENQGFRVLRFWNTDVMSNIDGVLHVISASVANGERRTSPSHRFAAGPSLSQVGEGALMRRIAPILAVALLLAACAAHVASTVSHAPTAPGFILGLVQGFISPVTFMISFFQPEVAVYAVPNNGHWYDFGFLLGVGAFGLGGGSAARRR